MLFTALLSAAMAAVVPAAGSQSVLVAMLLI
jgi:hypothetical protein